jgi:transposase
MLPLLKRFEIQLLRRFRHSQEEIAKFSGVSVSTVHRVEREPDVVDVEDAQVRGSRGIGRPSATAPFRTFVTDLLAAEPDLLSLEVLRRARLRGYEGRKSAFYELVAALRPRPVCPVVRFEGLAGEFSQHDFGEVEVRFLDGTKRRVHFFASRLKYSRWVQVSLVPDQRVESLVRALVDHFAALGGVPLVAVFDRPKTVALTWRKDGQVVEWNPTFAAVTLELGIGVDLCWPYRANQKGSVENLVGWVKGSFFKQRRFADEVDLKEQLAAWHVEVNTRTPCRATGVVPEVRLAEERPRLRPLKVAPDHLALRVPVQVGPTGYVLHDTHEYSMAAEAMALPGTLFLYRDRVRIVAGRFEAQHVRLFTPHAKSTLPEHAASHVATVSGRRGRLYLKREHLLDLGPCAHAFLTEIVHRRPRAWAKEVEELHALLERCGPDRLRTALDRALRAGTFGAEYVAHHVADAVFEGLPLLPSAEPAPR